MDRSLKGLMMINRGRFLNLSPINVIPIIPPYIPPIPIITTPQPSPTGIVYTAADFGENAINNHAAGVDAHSEKNQVIFNYITRNFRNRCTSYESFRTPPFVSFVDDELAACKTLKADIVYTPYVDAARWTNTDNDNFILTVGSHYDNDGTDGIIGNYDQERHDITANANTFLSDSIAVSARRDIPVEFKKSTSWGLGMEFFEDCSPEGLDPYYPTKDVPSCFAEIRTSADGYYMYGNRTMDMNTNLQLAIGTEITLINGGLTEKRLVTEILPNGTLKVNTPFTPFLVQAPIILKTLINGVLTKIGEVGTEGTGNILRAHNIKTTDFTTLTVGQQVTLEYPDLHTENKLVQTINRYDNITLTTNATPYSLQGIYVWYMDTIGRYIGGQAQSWATPLVAAKLKVIKMTTGATWDTVRAAARATAKRNPTGIPEIDNATWDMWRGFGCIDVQAARNNINNNA